METQYFDGEYFYKSYNIISESDRLDLIEESELYLKTHQKIEELHPPVMAENFLTNEILSHRCWKNLQKEISTNIMKCSKYFLNANLCLQSCWINKTGYYTKEDITNNLYFDDNLESYTDNHYHAHPEDQVIICIFYLQNFDKKHGTLVKTKNGSLVMDGTENSLSIFNPKLYHCAVIPSPEVSLKYPRYVIAMSFTKNNLGS
jgi:hypothetical protein